MAIKKYFAEADNTITNAYEENFNTRGTGSNMGQADILEVFSLYAQRDSSSDEHSRVLIRFPISDIKSDRDAGLIAASGSVSFYLNLYNAEHTRTLPRDFYLTVAAVSSSVSSSWEEGNGLDMENYSDLTYDVTGSNWVRIGGSTSWATTGGDWYRDNYSSYSKRFPNGDEDLRLDVTTLVEQWINSDGNVLGKKDNHGFIIKLTGSYEAKSVRNPTGSVRSYYTKKFFARSSEFFFNRPTIEAQWDSSRRDNRGNFYFSSSIAGPSDNLNNLYMYNYVRGKLRDIAGNSNLVPVMRLYYSSGSIPEGNAQYFRNASNVAVNFLSASRVSTGIYKCRFSVTSSTTTTTYPYLLDVWDVHIPLDDEVPETVHTGSAIDPKKRTFSNINPNGNYVITIPNLKKSYMKGTNERFRLYVREKNWSPNVYTKSITTPETLLIESASYQIIRSVDNEIVIQHGTASSNCTGLSYDISGNYFDLDMDLLEEGYSYGLKFSFYEDSVGSWRDQPHIFKFRVEKNEY